MNLRIGKISFIILLLYLCQIPSAFSQPAKPTGLVVLGISQTRHILAWKDNATDETGYQIQRSVDGGAWTGLTTLGPQVGYPRHVITGADPGAEYRYRLRTQRSTDNTNSDWSNIARDPDWVERANIRVFYNTNVCLPGNCVPATTNMSGENAMAARMADLLEGALSEYQAMGFRDPWWPAGADSEPVNLVMADGGGAHGDEGVRLGPGFMGVYDHTANLGDASSFIIPVHEYFHAVQNAYGYLKKDPSGAWMIEGQARAIQDLVCAPVDGDNCVNVDDDPSGTANYVGQVNNYLGNPNRPVNEISYTAALFWTYLCQRYGAERTEAHLGLDFIAEFLHESAQNLDRDGIEVMDATLKGLGENDSFEDVFKDFVVANYAKDLSGPSVPDKYQYVDESQAPGSYDPVRLDLDRAITIGEQVGPSLTDVTRWGARYYRIRPDASVPTISVDVKVDSNELAYFTILAVKNDDIALVHKHTGESFSKSFDNDSYDSVILIVAGLKHNVNFRYVFQAADPVLRIVEPQTARPALVGSQATPEKFLVQVEVLDASGDPINGIDPGDFTFTVGTQVLTASHLITNAYVQGQYWFILRAPVQSAAGFHDLRIDWSSQSDIETDAVNYVARTDVDNVIVIDRSGSMNYEKITGAKNAAKLYAGSWRTGDMIGVASFTSLAAVDLSLRAWSTVSRQDAVDAINAIDADPFGLTSIGAGLATGLSELDARGSSSDDWALILLSDGINTFGSDIKDFLKTYKDRVNGGQKVPHVHTIAIGPDANRPDLQNLAAVTGGTYHFVSEPATTSTSSNASVLNGPTQDYWRDIAETFRVVSERVTRQGQVLSQRGKTIAAETITHQIPVDAGASELVATASWRFGSPVIALQDPNGVFHLPFVEEPGEHKIYRIASPIPGVWEFKLGVSTGCQEFCLSEYLVEASIKSDLVMDLHLGLAPAGRVVGRAMPVVVSLAGSGPVSSAVVTATLTFPSGGAFTGFLFDDGMHGDGAAGDGLFGNIIYNAFEIGDYKMEISALGDSPDTGLFFRRLTGWFHMTEDVNVDNDCFPDGYEDDIGLDSQRDDGNEDPDLDGLSSCIEYLLGLHPLDDDSDNGGEIDGSEVAGGRNGLEPVDDFLDSPRVSTSPGVGEVRVRFSGPPNVVGFDIFRAIEENPVSQSPPPWNAFQPISAGYFAGAPYEYIDDQVNNNLKYWYRLVSIGPEGQRSKPSDPVAGIPRADPYPPHGNVLINDGAAGTDSLDVVLQLYASDEWDPEAMIDRRDFFDPLSEISGVSEMLVANESSFEGGSWQVFKSEIPWRLGRVGVASVFVKYRDAAGNVSDVVHSSIEVSQPQADLVVTKTDGLTSALAGTKTSYTINLTNTGPDYIAGVEVTDKFVAELVAPAWTCQATGGAVCDTEQNTGDIKDFADLPVGSAVTYSVSARILTGATGTLSNKVQITAPAANTGDDSATDHTSLLCSNTDEQLSGFVLVEGDEVECDIPGVISVEDISVGANAGLRLFANDVGFSGVIRVLAGGTLSVSIQ